MQRDHGRTDYVPVRMNATRCKAEGCDELARQKGLCDKHYQRLRSYGDPNHVPDPVRTNAGACSVPGCGKAASTRGLCQAHYRALLRHGDPTVNKRATAKSRAQVQPPRGPRPFNGPCSELGCGKVATRSGKCARHNRLSRTESAARPMLSEAAIRQIQSNRTASIQQLAEQFLTTPTTVVAVQGGRNWGYLKD